MSSTAQAKVGSGKMIGANLAIRSAPAANFEGLRAARPDLSEVSSADKLETAPVKPRYAPSKQAAYLEAQKAGLNPEMLHRCGFGPGLNYNI